MQMTGLNLGEDCSSQYFEYFVYLLGGVHASDTFAHSSLLSTNCHPINSEGGTDLQLAWIMQFHRFQVVSLGFINTASMKILAS